MGSGAPLYCSAPSRGAVAQRFRVPVCHPGGRGFEPRQPRLDPRRGMTHRAPSATAGGAFAFSGSVATSTYHVPVLADVVRAWADGSRRAVDATLGGGGHAALLVAAGAQVLAVDRDTEAIAATRAWLGEDGIRYATGTFASAKVLGSIAAFRPDRILRPRRVLAPAGHGRTRVHVPAGSAPRHAYDAGAGSTRRGAAQPLAGRPAGVLLRGLRRRAAAPGASPGARDREAPGARPLRRERRPRVRDPRNAGPALRPGRLRAPLPGAAHRGEPGAGADRAGAPGAARGAPAGRAAGRDQLSLGRGSHREARLPGLEQDVRVPAAPARVHVPGAVARAGADQEGATARRA